MAWCVEKHDTSVIELYCVRSDMLGDSACLTFGNPRISNCVEEARFAVVDVTHDGDHRGSGGEVAFLSGSRFYFQHLLFE